MRRRGPVWRGKTAIWMSWKASGNRLESFRDVWPVSSLMSGTRLPGSVVADEDVGEDDELAHHRDERELGGLALGAEAVVDDLEVRVAARRRMGRQVERPAEVAPAAADLRPTLPCPGLARERGEAGEARGRGRFEGELGYFREDRRGGDQGDPGMLQRISALRARPASEATRSAIAASTSSSARSICRRRVACWRFRSASVSRPARFVAAVRSRTSALRASRSSWNSARTTDLGSCGAGSSIAPMRAISRASPRFPVPHACHASLALDFPFGSREGRGATHLSIGPFGPAAMRSDPSRRRRVANLRQRPTLPQIALKGTDKRPYELRRGSAGCRRGCKLEGRRPFVGTSRR